MEVMFMALTDREIKILSEIEEWENKLSHYKANDLQNIFTKYVEHSFSLLPEDMQNLFFSVVDDWLFHLHAIIQGRDFQRKTQEQILAAARVFHDKIDHVEDMRSLSIDQLQFITKQQVSRHRFYSFIQGGISGTGNVLFLGMDIPAIAIINLRLVQLIATSYGYNVNKPFEMMMSLKVFYASTLPRQLQKCVWDELFQDLNNSNQHYFYDGSEEISDEKWLEQPLKQVLKSLVILLLRKKSFQGIPIVSMAIGALMNERITKKVSDFAHKFYQRRFISEKVENNDEYKRT